MLIYGNQWPGRLVLRAELYGRLHSESALLACLRHGVNTWWRTSVSIGKYLGMICNSANSRILWWDMMGKSVRNRQQFHGRTHGFLEKFSSDFSSSQGFIWWVTGCYRQLWFGLMGHFLFEASSWNPNGWLLIIVTVVCCVSSMLNHPWIFPKPSSYWGTPMTMDSPIYIHCNFRSNIIFRTSFESAKLELSRDILHLYHALFVTPAFTSLVAQFYALLIHTLNLYQPI